MIYLITYGNNKFELSKQRLFKQAINVKWFDKVEMYGPNDLDNNFKNKFKNILDKPRIGGYGIWRPYIINKKLNNIEENDILIYLDAGCSINTKGKQRFDEYLDILNNSNEGIISFQMVHSEKKYTTKEIFKYFNIDINNPIANSGQILDGILIMKKNKNLMKLIDKWLKAVYEFPLMFTDVFNKNQPSYFIDNRHEQSVFSVIRKMGTSIIINDETYFKPFGNKESLKYPFWATRIKL
jgi:hypothetical protein